MDGCVREIGALVAATAMGYRGEIGSIGLKKNAVKTDCREDFSQTGVLESDYAIDAKVKVTAAAYALHIVGCPAKTVEHDTRLDGHTVEDVECIVETITHM